MSAVWFYPNDNWSIGPTQRLGIYRGTAPKATELNWEANPRRSNHPKNSRSHAELDLSTRRRGCFCLIRYTRLRQQPLTCCSSPHDSDPAEAEEK
ncbi:KLTH0E08976p [Lachancea thermotolerans CBS 6340]|uniref:KLTH0E08976p n=1 Tax=Lachancea thermotolerans (strain ATCC 56472 / CBS 6340 / NRRL Y-8284) TaxID=559295 RepID=C5DI17_LACTC|nr:KLTH0E08976p [Lachancea thermotolerans CBS 6340]CAR23428.1 KLTH0E08976p [Lachancea thermotolerans CBS 6340]